MSLSEVRARHSITDVLDSLGVHVPYRRPSGGYLVCCPVPAHEDRTPSCIIHEDTDRYYCFGCGSHGDVLQLVRDVLGVSLPAAIEYLDGPSTVPNRSSTPLPPPRPATTSRDRIVEANSAAWELLTAPGPASQANAYLWRRGIPTETLQKAPAGFAGYTPARRDGLVEHLRARSFTDAEILDSGWAVRRDGELRDRFRRRVLFPIHDHAGSLVAVTGRDVTGQSRAKYLNTPTTAAFSKSTCLYTPAISTLASAPTTVVCEGPLDALAIAASSLAAGHPVRPVALCGTALTRTHVETIAATRPQRVLLCPDGDAAGRTAGERWRNLFAETDVTAEIVTIPEGHDPASWLNGRELLLTL